MPPGVVERRGAEVGTDKATARVEAEAADSLSQSTATMPCFAVARNGVRRE